MKKYFSLTFILFFLVISLYANPAQFSRLSVENNMAILLWDWDDAGEILDSLKCTNHEFYIDIEDDYIEENIVQTFLYTGKSDRLYLGYCSEEYSELKNNSRHVYLNEERQIPSFYKDSYGKQWEVFSVDTTTGKEFELKIKNHIENISENQIETKILLEFNEPTYLCSNENVYITVKNKSKERYIRGIPSSRTTSKIQWISEDTFTFPVINYPLTSNQVLYLEEKVIERLFFGDVDFFLLDLEEFEHYFLYVTKRQLRYYRNAIYALHGRKFIDNELQTYFSSIPMYKFNKDFKEVDLTEEERCWINNIHHLENLFGNKIKEYK